MLIVFRITGVLDLIKISGNSSQTKLAHTRARQQKHPTKMLQVAHMRNVNSVHFITQIKVG